MDGSIFCEKNNVVERCKNSYACYFIPDFGKNEINVHKFNFLEENFEFMGTIGLAIWDIKCKFDLSSLTYIEIFNLNSFTKSFLIILLNENKDLLFLLISYKNSVFEIIQIKKFQIETEKGQEMEKGGYCFECRHIIENKYIHLI